MKAVAVEMQPGLSLATLLAAVWLAVPPAAATRVAAAKGHLAAANAQAKSGVRGSLAPDEGYQLNPDQLRNIYSVDCLKEMQRNPRFRCSDPSQAKRHWPYVPSWGVFRKVQELTTTLGQSTEAPSTTTGPEVEMEEEPLSIANYPNWNEARCHSQDEFFCDPEGLLEEHARKNLTDDLRTLREQSKVKCGQLDSALEGEDKTHYEHFNLGVAIMGKWSSDEIDPVTLQKLGVVLMARWGLMPSYNGVGLSPDAIESDEQKYGDNCPNAAVLIVLPEYGEVFLSSPSCEFICSDRGGPEVMNAAIGALHREGLASAVKAGIEQVQRIIKATTPLSLEEPARRLSRRSIGRDRKAQKQVKDRIWVITQRALLAIILFTSVVGFAVFVAYNVVPGPRELRLKTRQAS